MQSSGASSRPMLMTGTLATGTAELCHLCCILLAPGQPGPFVTLSMTCVQQLTSKHRSQVTYFGSGQGWAL